MDREYGKRKGERAGRIVFLLLPVLGFFVSAAPVWARWNIAETLQEYVRAGFPWANVVVEDVRTSAELPSRAPESISVVKAPPGKAVFRLDFPGGRSITASAMVKTFDRVIMSRGSFSGGYTLGRDDLYATLMESARIPMDAVRDERRLVGRTLSRSIVANAIMTEPMVAEKDVVKRGHRVVLCVESPDFSIRAAGETKSDAVVGGDVKVLNLSSRKTVTGRLVDEDTVKVEF